MFQPFNFSFEAMLRLRMAKIPAYFIGFLALCCWTAIANAEYTIYKDPKRSISDRIKDLLDKMTLEEKIGQMTQIERSVASTEVMKKYYIGSLIKAALSTI